MSSPHSPGGFRRGLLWTSAGSILNLGLLALETIIAVRLLPTEVFGAYVLLLTTVTFLMMVADFGCKVTAIQLISASDRPRQLVVVGTVLTFRLTVLASGAALIWLFHDWLRLLEPSPLLLQSVGAIPFMLVTASLDELLFAILQGFQSYRSMVIAQVLRGLLRITLSTTLLLFFEAGLSALVISWCLSFTATIAYQLWALPVRTLWQARWGTLREILRFGAPLQATRFLAFLAARLHLTLLGALGGVEAVAFFAAADRIPEALKTLSDAYFRVFFPTMTSLLASGRRAAAALMFDRSLRLISFGSALGALVAIAFSHEIVTLLFSARYVASAPVFALLMLALHMALVVNVMGYTLTAAGRPGRSLGVDGLWLAVGALGDLLLIPLLGAVGAALAAVGATYASGPLAAWLVRRDGLAAALVPGLRQATLLGLGGALAWWVQPADPALSLVYRLAIIVAFIGLSLRLGTISADDLALVLGERRLPSSAAEAPRPAHLTETQG